MTFDTASDTRIRRLWKAFEDHALILPNVGRPHMTMAQIEVDALEGAAGALAEVASGMHGTRLAFDSIGLFPGEQPVLFLNPVASAGLLALHRRVHDALRKADSTLVAGPGHYLPGNWVPHVTLGRLHAAASLGEAMTIANEFRLRFEVTGIALSALRSEAICPS